MQSVTVQFCPTVKSSSVLGLSHRHFETFQLVIKAVLMGKKQILLSLGFRKI